MAWFQVSFYSQSYQFSVPLNILIPADVVGPVPPSGERVLYKTLYLLHGYFGNYTDWLLSGQLQELSQQFNLAIVLPSGHNGFFVDQPRARIRGSEFIAKELVSFTREAFPLSHRREDTLLGGLSMGGYGTMYNALKHGDVFGHAIALSAPVDAYKGNDPSAPQEMGLTQGYFEALHGDLANVAESDRNLSVLAKSVLDEGQPVTNLYMACGYNDRLVFENRALHEAFAEMGFPHFYEEGPGTHEWPFWNTYLRRGLEHTLQVAPVQFPNPFWVEKTDYSY